MSMIESKNFYKNYNVYCGKLKKNILKLTVDDPYFYFRLSK